MSPAQVSTPAVPGDLPNGSGAAAILAAGIGACALAVLSIAADHIAQFQKLMIFYQPTGPLSGVTTSALVVWLAAWFVLARWWRSKSVPIVPITAAALALLVLSLLLTFPPLADLI